MFRAELALLAARVVMGQFCLGAVTHNLSFMLFNWWCHAVGCQWLRVKEKHKNESATAVGEN